MSHDKMKPDWNFWNFVAGTIAVIVAVVFGYLGLTKEAGTDTPKIVAIYNSALTQLAPAASSPDTTSTIGKPAPDTHANAAQTVNYVPMHSLSQDHTLLLANADSARIFSNDASSVHIPLRLTSSSGTWKIFAPLSVGLQDWSLTTESGKHCRIDAELNGIPAYASEDFESHIAAMPIVTASSESIEYASLSAHCDQLINNSDNFHLAAQLYRLPAGVTPGLRGNQNPLILNFSSNGIPVQ